MISEVKIEALRGHLREHMEKCLDHMKQEFSAVRTGKASPALVENIGIDYYGTTTKLRDLANITAPEPRLLVIQPYDPSSVSTIEKALSQSQLGINPVSDGKILRLPIPELSEERRASLTKQVKGKAEETRVAVRNVRRDGNELAKKANKDSLLTEDGHKQMLEDIQKMTDDYIKKIDHELHAKENELMNI